MAYLDRQSQLGIGKVPVWPVVGLGESVPRLKWDVIFFWQQEAGVVGRVDMSGSFQCLSREGSPSFKAPRAMLSVPGQSNPCCCLMRGWLLF